MTFPATMTLVPAGRRTSLAWMVGAGAAAPLGGGLTLDVVWRYLASGTVTTGAGTGRVLFHDGRVHYLNDHWDIDHPFERIPFDTAMAPDRKAVNWITPRLTPGETHRVLTGICWFYDLRDIKETQRNLQA